MQHLLSSIFFLLMGMNSIIFASFPSEWKSEHFSESVAITQSFCEQFFFELAVLFPHVYIDHSTYRHWVDAIENTWCSTLEAVAETMDEGGVLQYSRKWPSHLLPYWSHLVHCRKWNIHPKLMADKETWMLGSSWITMQNPPFACKNRKMKGQGVTCCRQKLPFFPA